MVEVYCIRAKVSGLVLLHQLLLALIVVEVINRFHLISLDLSRGKSKSFHPGLEKQLYLKCQTAVKERP